ncbi:ABC transporter ATP-binding protein [Rhodoplanes elegans]|uniref:ABC transporter ATP-binding protein n=1 Tax=Rhodoplanes elegans TaxID=29408 RepID=A0A327K5P0_9BRAD|nr:ABC transporter ATP-binding protein [Rhodoplanes elegans]MBK5959166.1 ABC transporter ATP-binding protein [Rhodoplanes elegans]RAI33717.1 ABC transporter ATP-binding protein [Rhodoplanes elegans]
MTGSPIVALHGVAKRYGTVEAVRDVSLSAAAGECVALVGHNGAGKTTLMKLMLGLLHPTRGSVRVLGSDPDAGAFAVRRRIGFLPETIAFNPALTATEMLRFYARLKREPMRVVAPLLDRVGLAAAADRRIGTYSKGMRQRLGLAQALLGEPALLLLDEPTTGLDPALRGQLYGLIRDLVRGGATVLISTHALGELEGVADRVVILDRGVVLADGSLGALRRLARLPIRVRVKVAGAQAEAPAWLRESGEAFNGHHFDLTCTPAGKMALLRRAVESGAAIDDIEVAEPTLDDLYAHFLRAGDAR